MYKLILILNIEIFMIFLMRMELENTKAGSYIGTYRAKHVLLHLDHPHIPSEANVQSFPFMKHTGRISVSICIPHVIFPVLEK